MALEVVRLALSSVTEETPSQEGPLEWHQHSLLIQRQGQEILDKVAQGEAELAVFDTFSNELVRFLTERIDAVAKSCRLNSSRRENSGGSFIS